MNYKLEKFWNKADIVEDVLAKFMNYKLEKFWNFENLGSSPISSANEL